jgi:hypothetical protein
MREEKKNLNINESSERIQNRQKENEDSKQTTFRDKIWKIIKKHSTSSILSIALIIVIAWFSIKLNSAKKQFEAEKNELVIKYELQINSLQLKNIEFTSRVFSWSVRSEMMRNNEENLNQLVSVFIKESNANLLQIVSYEKNRIIISSDKKYEGESFVAPSNIDFKKQVTRADSIEMIVYTPIFGLNNEIGLLIVKTRK